MRMASWIGLCVLTILATFGASAEVPASKEKFHLYLLIGQSNMAGRGKVEEQDRTAHPRVFAFNKENKWVPGADPIHFDKSAAGVGPGLSFGKAMAEADPSVTIGLIPCAVGGSPLSSWQPGAEDKATKTHPWDDMMVRVQLAMKEGTLKGILWHQGESDSNEKLASGYGGRLEQTLGLLRDELASHHVPIVVGQLFAFKPNEFKDLVNVELAHFPRRLANTGVVTSEGMKDRGDSIHLDSASAREFGKRYAKEMLRLQSLPAPIIVKLWEQGLPDPQSAKPVGEEVKKIARVRNVSEPTITVYLPPKEKANGAAIIICPGGGYGALAIEKEGDCVARWLNEIGVAGIVLKYRLNQYPQPAALMDAQQAIRIVRERATEWNIDSKKVGILGFSAGGHLAAYVSNSDVVPVAGPQYGKWKAIDSKPNFSVIVYGVLPFDASDKNASAMYVPIALSAKTPPAFLVHAKDDKFPAEAAKIYAAKLKELGIPSAVRVFDKGGHGFGMGVSGGAVATWPAECEEWLREEKWIK